MIAYFGAKGGKKFRDFINVKIPKTGIKTYVEPFSGSMGTYLEDNEGTFDNIENIVYNDMNKHQVNLMYCCKYSEKMLEAIESLKKSVLKIDENASVVEKWEFYKGIYNKFKSNTFLDDNNFELGDFKRASMYAFLITSAFSGVHPRGGGFSGFNKKKEELKLEILIRKLKTNKYTDKLNKITNFHNIDFEELIKKYDSEDTYLYLDPPYARMDPKTGLDDARRLFWYGSDDEGVFGVQSHRRLLELIKNSKCRWSLSYYYFPLLDELLPKDKYLWFEKEVFRSSAQGGNNHESKKDSEKVSAKGTELLILNYNPETGELL